MKRLIIYHAIKPGVDCPDGKAASWVAKRKYPDAELLGHSYGEDLPDVSGYNSLIIVDYSFKRDVLEQWTAHGIEVMVIDHHKTALNDLADFEGAIFNMQESGATLAWRYFFPDEPMPAWLEYVKDRDLWNFELPYSEELHEAIAANGRSLEQIEEYCKLTQQELITEFAAKGVELLRPKRERIAELASTAEVIEVKGYQVISAVVPEADGRLISDLASHLYKQHSELDFALIATKYLQKQPNGWGLSFRSDKNGNNFDVSAVAKRFDGGGHHNASGGFIAKPDDKWEEIKELLR